MPAPDQPIRFPHGPIGLSIGLGVLTDRSVRVWVRDPSGAADPIILRVAGRPEAEARPVPAVATDWITAVDLPLDRPAPQAPFTVETRGRTLTGRLAPSPGDRVAFSFGLGSCNLPFDVAGGTVAPAERAGIYPAFDRALRRVGAGFLTLIGDQIYADHPDEISILDRLERHPEWSDQDLVEAYRAQYRGFFAEPGYRSLIETWPTCFVWDDHDIRDGWGSLIRPDDHDRRLFPAADRAYREYQHLRNPGGSIDARPPYQYHFWWGDTGFFVFDGRGVRDYLAGILHGETQLRALAAFLAEAGDRGVATVFLITSVPLVHFSPLIVRLTEGIPHTYPLAMRERWTATPFRAEHDAIAESLFAWQAARPDRQVILLSGDVHCGAAFRIRDRRGPGTIRQWTSSPLTTPLTLPVRAANLLGTRFLSWGDLPYRVDREALLRTHNFGIVEVVPLPESGHLAQLTLHAYRAGDPAARPAVRIVARP